MNYKNCVELIPNLHEARRIASAYVEDSRRLNLEELKVCLQKTEGQYLSYENVKRTLDMLKLDENPAVRIIFPIILCNYLLDEDDFMSVQKETEEAVLAYEQSVIDASNNMESKSFSKEMLLFKFILDKAWEHNEGISVDEKNLIEEVRRYLNISLLEQNTLEAKADRYPTKGNASHTRSDIEAVRKALQSAGLLFFVKNADGYSCDIIPEEIAFEIRKYYGIEIKKYGYAQIIEYVTKVGKKQYLLDMIDRFNDNPDTANIDLPANPTIEYLQNVIMKNIRPSNLIGGFSPNDGFEKSLLVKWCGDLGLNVSGNKPALILRILEYYDGLRKIEISTEDERAAYYEVYTSLASRDLAYLRSCKLIEKDLECEHLFEKATNYLFEVKLKNKPLNLTGTEHPDGKLSFMDKYIMWDNKSKETLVNLKDHLPQFDRYIKASDKPVAVFIVIGPDFTQNSVTECAQYALLNDTQILLITAEELKTLADYWEKTHPDESFNLGYFKQNGRFNKDLLPK